MVFFSFLLLCLLLCVYYIKMSVKQTAPLFLLCSANPPRHSLNENQLPVCPSHWMRLVCSHSSRANVRYTYTVTHTHKRERKRKNSSKNKGRNLICCQTFPPHLRPSLCSFPFFLNIYFVSFLLNLTNDELIIQLFLL